MTWCIGFSGVWSKQEREFWKAEAKYVIENYFRMLTKRCRPPNGKCCQCKQGVRVSVKLNFYEPSSLWDRLFGSFDVKVDVHDGYGTGGVSGVESSSGDTSLQESDVYSSENSGVGGMSEQNVIIHEFGHLLGLDHPGADADLTENSPEDYEYSKEGVLGKDNLMGRGMIMTESDFNKAFCERINWGECK